MIVFSQKQDQYRLCQLMSVETAMFLQTPLAVLSHCCFDLKYGPRGCVVILKSSNDGLAYTDTIHGEAVLALGEGLLLFNTPNQIIPSHCQI